MDALDPPANEVVVERLRKEATTWVNAVALQCGRIDRRHKRRFLKPAETEALEVDLHFFLVGIVRLRRCVERVAKRVPDLEAALRAQLEQFDDTVPGLAKLRNVSEHVDEYNIDAGRDRSVSRRQVQTWYVDSRTDGGLIWGWLGERLDVRAADGAAIALYRDFIAETDAWFRLG